MQATLLPAYPAYLWGDTCTALPLIDETGLSLKAETMPPGTTEQLHYHKKARQYFCIQAGIASFELPEGVVTVTAGQTLLIPAGLPHCISNRKMEMLEFLVLSLPSTTDDRIPLPALPT